MPLPHRSLLVAAMALAGLAGCESIVERPPPPESDGIHGFADGCYALDATRPGSRDTRWLVPTEDGAGFDHGEAKAGKFNIVRSSTYLFESLSHLFLH